MNKENTKNFKTSATNIEFGSNDISVIQKHEADGSSNNRSESTIIETIERNKANVVATGSSLHSDISLKIHSLQRSSDQLFHGNPHETAKNKTFPSLVESTEREEINERRNQVILLIFSIISFDRASICWCSGIEERRLVQMN